MTTYQVKVQHYGKQQEVMFETSNQIQALDFMRDQCNVIKGYNKRYGTMPDGRFVVFAGKDGYFKTQIWIREV